MSHSKVNPDADELVPSDVLPPGTLPPLKYRDLPPVIPIRQMIGPSIILAGLALGSGEYVLWPYITYSSGFVFFWACLVGVGTQYFLNMEIVRWTLATGESAITGFIRLHRVWACVFLVLNVVPWLIPAWSTGAAQILRWIVLSREQSALAVPPAMGVEWLAIAGMLLCGIVLTAENVILSFVF